MKSYNEESTLQKRVPMKLNLIFLPALWCLTLLLALTSSVKADGSYRIVDGAGGVPLNVFTVGPADGQGILLIHGIGQSHLSFEKQFESTLAEKFRLVTFDLRGHGNSGKPWEETSYSDPMAWATDVKNIMEATNLSKPILVAWSYGTVVAADYIRHYGTDQISALNLIGGYGGLITPPPQDPDDANVNTFAELRALQYSSDIRDNIEASRQVVGWLTARKMSKAWRERATAIGLMLPIYARKAMWKQPTNNEDLVPEIAIPVLISIGAKDLGSSVSSGEELARRLSNARVSIYPESGHSPFLEAPERFNTELEDLATSVAGH